MIPSNHSLCNHQSRFQSRNLRSIHLTDPIKSSDVRPSHYCWLLACACACAASKPTCSSFFFLFFSPLNLSHRETHTHNHNVIRERRTATSITGCVVFSKIAELSKSHKTLYKGTFFLPSLACLWSSFVALRRKTTREVGAQ